MGGSPIPCWYVKDGYKPRVKALMLSVPSDRTIQTMSPTAATITTLTP